MASAYPYHTDYPMNMLTFLQRQEIANFLDAYPTHFHALAEQLGYDFQRSRAIWNRGLGGPLRSATQHLLNEYEQDGGTIQGLNWALHRIGSAAANIMADFMPAIHAEYDRRTRERVFPDRGGGQQNSCLCPDCTGHRPSFSRSISQPSQPGTRPTSNVSRRRHHTENQTTDRYERSNNQGHRNTPSAGHGDGDQRHDSGFSMSSQANGQHESNYGHSHQAGVSHMRSVPSCTCEKCRLSSDPKETQLLTLYSQEKSGCILSQLDNVTIQQDGHVSRNGATYTRTQSDSAVNTKQRKLCSNSKDGRHYIGEKLNSCRTCSLYTCGRRSWGGRDADVDRSRTSNSDGDLSTPGSVELIYNRQDYADNRPDLNNLRPFNGERVTSENNLNNHQNIPISQSVNDTQTDNETLEAGPSQIASGYIPSGRSQSDTNSERRQETQTDRVDTRPVVFMTYSNHNPRHIMEIKKLIKLLSDAGIRVKIDMNPECFDELGVNTNEWLDRSVDSARYVIICISPTYRQDVQGPQNPDNPSPQITQLNARYIYDRLRTEYIHNQSQNRRMIPVLFPNSGAEYETHVPHMMQATLVYTFPMHVQVIIDRILGHDRQLPYV